MSDGWFVIVLSSCFDIECEEDFIEEVVCIFGYDNIFIYMLVGVLMLVVELEVCIGEFVLCE